MCESTEVIHLSKNTVIAILQHRMKQAKVVGMGWWDRVQISLGRAYLWERPKSACLQLSVDEIARGTWQGSDRTTDGEQEREGGRTVYICLVYYPAHPFSPAFHLHQRGA